MPASSCHKVVVDISASESRLVTLWVKINSLIFPMVAILIYIIVAILILVGIIGSILPFLPGPPLIFFGALIYGFYDKFDKVNFIILSILLVDRKSVV